MEDIFNTTVLCDQCNQKTEKKIVIADGFQMRSWECAKCHKTWQHPGDVQEYQNFKQLKNKTFHVKLRYVGNSYAVSIPREIIAFEEEALKEFAKMDKILKMMVEEPGKVSIFFSSNMKRFMNEDEDEDGERLQ